MVNVNCKVNIPGLIHDEKDTIFLGLAAVQSKKSPFLAIVNEVAAIYRNEALSITSIQPITLVTYQPKYWCLQYCQFTDNQPMVDSTQQSLPLFPPKMLLRMSI